VRGLILIVSYWIHLVASVIWIGGIAFVLFIAIPKAKQVLGAEASKLMVEFGKRFTLLVNYSIAFLALTGIALISLNRAPLAGEIFEKRWMIIAIKHIVFLAMIIIHFYRGLVLAPKIGKAASSAEKANLQKLSLSLVKVNFGLGLITLLLSGILHIA
jgi:uncharacterized membrane protein